MATIALTAAALVFKQVLLVVLQGATRIAKRQFGKPEDARAFRGSDETGDPPIVRTAQDVIRNGLESEPIFVVLLLVLHSVQPELDVSSYAITFVVARLLHAGFFLARSQPMRSITFAVGFFAMVGLAVRLASYGIGAL